MENSDISLEVSSDFIENITRRDCDVRISVYSSGFDSYNIVNNFSMLSDVSRSFLGISIFITP